MLYRTSKISPIHASNLQHVREDKPEKRSIVTISTIAVAHWKVVDIAFNLLESGLKTSCMKLEIGKAALLKTLLESFDPPFY